jgi:hypothetical protein
LHEELGDVFELRNVFDRWPGAFDGKGDRFPMARARERAQVLREALRGRRVVFVGKAVAKAFGVSGDVLCWRRAGHLGFEFSVVPHPSGINTWWNDEDNRRAASHFFRGLAETAIVVGIVGVSASPLRAGQ